MRFLILYYSGHGGDLVAKIVNDPTMDNIPGPDTASQLLDDLGADTVEVVMELPEGDFRPNMIGGESGEEVRVSFIDNPSEA